jgi:GAF domain-containing protein
VIEQPGGEPFAHPLRNPERLLALARTGLTAYPDPEMDAFAERVRRWLGVPIGLVSLVQAEQQILPGMSGLPEPWATKRATPLSHSFCRQVVATAGPLVVTDARADPALRDNLAIPGLGVVAYLGVPLTDEDGSVLGALCAIDAAPRRWTPTHLDVLRDLASGCSTELRLRLARHDADSERTRRDELEHTLRRSLERSRTLLTASQRFTDTSTVTDVRDRVGELVSSELAPSYVGISLLGPNRRMQRVNDPAFPLGAEGVRPWVNYDLSTVLPTATAAREQRLVHYPGRRSFDADHPPGARRLIRDLGLHAIVAAPLPGDAHAVGAVALGWDEPRTFNPSDLLMITTIAGYAAQALGRAELLQHRTTVAEQLQQAMLTMLPEVPGLRMAARYQAADSREHVGGDWYDAAALPSRDGCGPPALAVSVGDIIGHNLQAATIMGQVRAMVRQAAWDLPDAPPSRTLTAFETANAGLHLDAAGTAVLAHLHRTAGPRWAMTWSNAGHPAPIVIAPDGRARLLAEHDFLFGFPSASTLPRQDHRTEIEPGSLLFLHSDGLVEHRDRDLDVGTDELLTLLGRIHEREPADIVDLAVDALAPDSPDDVVAFAIRFLAED